MFKMFIKIDKKSGVFSSVEKQTRDFNRQFIREELTMACKH